MTNATPPRQTNRERIVKQTTMMFLATIVFALTSVLPVVADEMAADDRARLETLIKDYLLENPEVIIEAVEIYQQRQAEAEAANVTRTIEGLLPALAFDDNSPIAGNPDGDVTIVEFFDYRCSYCKRVGPDVQALMQNDPGVRFVYKEWPILGPESVFAARAALASREQGLYDSYHEALMTARSITEASVIEIAAEVGLDVEKLKADMQSPQIDAHLQKTRELAERLGINGTPAFVFGKELVKGAISGVQMAELVAAARE